MTIAGKLLSLFILVSLSATVVGQSIFASSVASSDRSLPPVITNSPDDLVLQAVGNEVFSKLTPAQLVEVKGLCKEPDSAKKIAQNIAGHLDEANFDYSSACVQVQDWQRQIDNSQDYCGKTAKGIACPVDEAKLLSECKNRLLGEKKFIGWEEDDQIYCGAQFERYKGDMARYCKGGSPTYHFTYCPLASINPVIEEQVKQQCLAKSCTPYIDKCGFTSCDCRGNPNLVIIDLQGKCPSVPADWKRMCQQNGGKPSEEYRGTCTIPKCDFGNFDQSISTLCPAIAVPPNWQEECRKRGGVPIPDDSRGCPTAECRMPGQQFCPPLPSASQDVLDKMCSDKGLQSSYGVDQTGCKYFMCVEKGKTQESSVSCPEISQSWYTECKKTGGTPEVKSDPYRPACMQFYCTSSSTTQTNSIGKACTTSTENAQRSRECIANGGNIYFDDGAGNCPIVKCHIPDANVVCPPDAFNPAMEQGCKASGGTIAVQSSGSCSYRFCQMGSSLNTVPSPVQPFNSTSSINCPAPQTCPDGAQAAYAYYDGKCPVYQCREKISPACSIPACPTGQYAEPTYAAGATAACPTYVCKSTSSVVPTTSINEYCPISAPTTCTSDQTYWSEPYSYTTPSGKSLTCYKSSCVSPASLPTCASSCSTYNYGGAYQIQSCASNQRLKTSYMTYTENSKACKCEGGKWCETDYSTLPVCAVGPGCQAPTCAAGETVQTSPQPYSTTVNGVQCACTSKWCSSPTSTTPSLGTPGVGGACPYIAPVTCNSNQISTSKLIPGYQNCWQTACVDATSLPACTTTSCGSSYTQTCTAGQVLSTNYYSMQENGASCRCQSQWCATDPAICASATCPASNGPTSCSSGQTLRTTTSPYSPPGCSSGSSGTTQLQCSSTWCETDPALCASQSCPPSTATCGTGYTSQSSGTYTYYAPGCGAPTTAGIQCPQYSCIQTATTSAVRVTGLQVAVPQQTTEAYNPGRIVEPYPGSQVADSRGDFGGANNMCTSSGEVDRDAFIRMCLASRRGSDFAKYTPEGIDDVCKREVSSNKAQLEKFCAGQKDPYSECKDGATNAKRALEEVYAQCKSIATREKVVELIEKKAAAECNKLQLGNKEGYKTIDELLGGTNLPPIEQSRLELASDSIVLTRAELAKLKADIARDVFSQVMSQFSTLFGLNAAEQGRQAAFKLQQVDKLSESAKTMREICVKLESGSDRDKCEAFATSIEKDATALKTEAQAQNIAAGGIVETLKALIGLTSGQPPVTPQSPGITVD